MRPPLFFNKLVAATKVANVAIIVDTALVAVLSLPGSTNVKPITAAISKVIATMMVMRVFSQFCASFVTAISPPKRISSKVTIPSALPRPLESILLSKNSTPVKISNAIDIFKSIEPAFDAFLPAISDMAISAANRTPIAVTTSSPFAISPMLNDDITFITAAMIKNAPDIISNIAPAFPAF